MMFSKMSGSGWSTYLQSVAVPCRACQWSTQVVPLRNLLFPKLFFVVHDTPAEQPKLVQSN